LRSGPKTRTAERSQRSTIFKKAGDYAAFEQVLEEAREQVEMRLLS
jgi:hypothetical protein